MLTMLLFVASAAMEPMKEEGKGPNKIDFEFAQAALIHSAAGDGVVHCDRFTGYKVHPTADPDVYRVRYREYRSQGPWQRMEATVRRDGNRWVWVRGDQPHCSITVFEN